MNVIRRFEVLWLALALLPGPALGQVKIGRVAGAPGSLAASAGVVFQASGNTGYLSNPGSGLIQKFRTTTGEVLASLQLAPGVGSITLSPDERTLAVVGVSAQKVYLVNTADLTVKKELTVAGSGYTARSNVVITSDNLTVMIADPPRNGIEAFNLVDGSYDRLIPAGLNPTILTLTLTPKGEERMGVLASGKFSDDEKSVHVIDTRTLAVVETRVLSATTESFNNVQFGGDGRNQYLIVPAYDSNSLQILTLNGSGVLASRASGGKGPSKVLTSPNGRYLAVINATSKSVELLSVPELFVVRDIPLSDSDFTVDTTLAFSPDSRTLFIPSLNTGEVILYDVEGGAIKKRIAVGERPVSVSVSGDGAVAALVNIGSNDLALVAVSPLPLYVPHLVQSATDYSGIALANFGAEQANVALVARDNAGKMLAGTANPVIVTVAPGKQLSMVTAQIFGFNTGATLAGWVEAYTLASGVGILYLSGNSAQTQLDGFLSSGAAAKMLSFSRITEGVSMFGSATSTEILIVNPSDTPANLTSRLYGNNLEGIGKLLSQVTRVMEPHGRVQGRISTLHSDVAYPLGQAYLELTSDVPIQAMEIVKMGDSIAMIPARQRGLPDTTFFGAQFATGGSGVLDTPIFTNLSFANVTEGPITITLQVTDDSGAILPAGSRPVKRTLQSHEVLQGNADTIFGFPSPLSDPALFTGSLKVTADQAGLVGDLVFGDARSGRYLSALSLGLTPAANVGFVHFAEGRFGEPAKGLYTGIAMFNPQREGADVAVEAYSPDGALLRRSEFRLDAGSHLSRTIGQIVEGLTQQSGGTLRVKSTAPLYVFEVFGSTESEFLAAVPPFPLP